MSESRKDLSLPTLPRHVHLIGIGGAGMSALAGMFHRRGLVVSGSDNGVYPPVSDYLRELGIEVMEGYRASNLSTRPDLVVVGNVIRRSNPEAMALERSGIPFLSMPEALLRYFAGQKTRIVVAGTHGKTTVSSMIAWILFREELDPGFMIGGLSNNFGTNHRLGGGEVFVIEGDEYDTAYFDKGPKFLHYHPHVAVVTSCEFDHADIYDSLAAIRDQFRALARMVPAEGRLVAYGDDSQVLAAVTGLATTVQTYGLDAARQWSAAGIEHTPEGIRMRLFKDRVEVASGTLPVMGVHNLLNAMAAVAATEAVGVEPQGAVDALRSFRGVRRRQEILGEYGGIVVIDDFAHHPTAVKETCAAVQSRFPHRRLVAVFEPRTNTSRRAVFQEAYVESFAAADEIVLREPRNVEAIPEGERFSSERLARELRSMGKDAHAFTDTDAVLRFLSDRLHRGDLVLVMSNGSFDDLSGRLAQSLEERTP